MKVWYHQYSIQRELVNPITTLRITAPIELNTIKPKKKELVKNIPINSTLIVDGDNSLSLSIETVIEHYMRIHCCLKSDQSIDFILILPLSVSLTDTNNSSNESLLFCLSSIN